MSERPEPLFILTCMRSFSSLVNAMLGQHPDLYGLPEQNLAVADTVGKLIKAARALRPASLSGPIRTVAQLEFGGQGESETRQAVRWLEDRSSWTTARLHEHVMGLVAPRTCIDKSPSTAMTRGFLGRLGRMFPRASILHLTRHPRSTCRSLYRLQQKQGGAGEARALKTDQEGLWFRIHRNILEYAAALPPAQYMQIRGEDLLARPDRYLPQICEWLGVDCGEDEYEAMLHPEDSPYAFVGPEVAPYGNDVNFLEDPHFRQREIPEERLEGPLDWEADGADRTFADETAALARYLGYR
jgi:hypothetical protein